MGHADRVAVLRLLRATARADAAAGPGGPLRFFGLSRVQAALSGRLPHLVPGGGAPPRRGVHRRHLPGREEIRTGVHRGGRGDPVDVRRPGGAGHRQRPQAPGRTEGQTRPGDPDRDLAGGGGGLRRPDGGAGVHQPGGAEDGRQPDGDGRLLGGALSSPHGAPRQRAGVLPGGGSPWPRPSRPGIRCGPRRLSSACATAGASPC